MIDWRPIDTKVLEWGDDCVFYAMKLNYPALNIWDRGHIFKKCESVRLGNRIFKKQPDGQLVDDRGYVITHYARVTGPDAPNPIREVWEKWKDAVNVNHPMTRYDAANAMYDLWQAIKDALGIEADREEEIC